MKRVSSIERDIFRPKGQLAKELDLASKSPLEVLDVLEEKLSDERRKRIEEVVARRTRRMTIAIEGVRDPHNTAAVIRTADAFGLQVVHVIERGDSFLSSRKVTQGAHKWVDMGFWKNGRDFTDAVHAEGKSVYIADADAASSIYELDPKDPLALVFGNEHEGVSDEMRDCSDGAFSIPMMGFAGSINVSAAAAITMAVMRRGGQGDLSEAEQAVLRARFYLRAVRSGYDIVKLEMGEG